MKLKRITASLLLAACTFACACGDKGGSGGPVTGDVVNEPNINQYVDGTLHDVNVDFDAPVSDFIVNGKTDYKIVSGRSNSAKGAGYIAEQVYKATGATIEIVDDLANVTLDENSKYILVGCEDLYVEEGGEMPDYDTIGLAGYKIETINKNVFINACNTMDGYQMGVLAFLREVLGYDMLSEDYVIYEKDGKVMPAMNILERPDFDYRKDGGTVNAVGDFGMGFTYVEPIMTTGESWVHNVYDFVSLEEMDENPDWASSDSTRWQLCFTSRGNKDSYAKMVEHIANKIKTHLINHPAQDTMMIGQHDIGGTTPMVQNCKCAACQASYNYYGTMAGAWLSLCNRASILVDEWLQTDEAIAIFGGVKQYNLLQLVYHTHVNPPIESDKNGYIYDEEGKGIPKVEMWFNSNGSMEEWEDAWTDEEGNSLESDTIKAWSDTHERIYTAPNVHYMYATSAADWVHSYYETQNAGWKNICDGWAGVGGKNAGTGGGEFFVWAYNLNSKFALYPYNSFDTSWETTRYFKRIGAKYMFWQSHYQNPNNSGFTKLNNYLDSKVEFDVNADYMHYVNKFFKYYFGVAGDDMQDFFEQIQAQCRWMEEVNQVSGNIHNIKYGNKENWPEGMVNNWWDMFSKAYDEIDQAYRVSDPELYQLYKTHLEIEEQFPLIILCTTYADSFEANDLKVMRQRFVDIFYGLNNTVHAEGTLMTEITDLWDLD